MIEAGCSVKVVQHHLGHAKASITLDTYAHLWPDSEGTTRKALDAGSRSIFNNESENSDVMDG